MSGQLTPQQAEVLGHALAYRKERANGYCAECARLDPGVCADHAADDAHAVRYAAVATQLRQEAGR